MILRPSQLSLSSVLLVDQSEEVREVLRTVLERKGVQVFETENAQVGLEMLREHQPGVVVLDLDADMADDGDICDQYDAESSAQATALILIGTMRRPKLSPSHGSQFVAKPYHFRPLIRTIEKLLENSIAASSGG